MNIYVKEEKQKLEEEVLKNVKSKKYNRFFSLTTGKYHNITEINVETIDKITIHQLLLEKNPEKGICDVWFYYCIYFNDKKTEKILSFV